MTLADIELANLDVKPFFMNQAMSSINVLNSYYPGIQTNVFTIDKQGSFHLHDLPTNSGNVVESISLEMSTSVILQSQKEFTSYLVKNDESTELFRDKGDNSTHTLISPIGYEGSLVGLLLTSIPLSIDASSLDYQVFDSIAMSIGAAFIAAELLEKYQERSNHMSIMLEVNTHLNIATTKTDYLNEISRFGKYFIHFDRAVLVLHPEETPEYFVVDSIEGEETGLQLGMSYPVCDTLVSQAIISGHYFIYKRSQKQEVTGIYRAGDTKDYPYDQVVGFPLARVSSALGVLVLESKQEHTLDQSEISIFDMISQSLGSALTRFSLYDRLTNYATIDTLTHLYNLRSLTQRFEEELARAGRFHNSLVVLFLDLDKFKSINDTYGHLVGDFVLRETAQIIRDTIRTGDIPGRYGGEEFVVIMVNTDAKSCMGSAKRICAAIHDHKYEMNEISIPNSISIGLAEFPGDGETMEELIQSADAAMYEAKRLGGNEVVKHQKGMVEKSKT